MPHYADALTIREGRARYFAANGFDERGYAARWVKLQAGPLPLYLLNTQARVRAVRLHDIHHVLTEYATTWTGEAEIAAWEIASSCAAHYAAWLLNLQAMAIGLALAPRAVFRAFMRGRHSANLYRREFDESLLAPTIGTLRRELRLDAAVREPTASDRRSFAAWAALSVVTLLATLAVMPAAVIALAWAIIG